MSIKKEIILSVNKSLPFHVRSEDLDAHVTRTKPLGAQMRCGMQVLNCILPYSVGS